MKITKISHSSLLIEENSARILIDPGNWSPMALASTNIDAILVTHEHPDHCDPESLYKIMANNPSATVITNSGTAEVVKKAGIPYRILDDGQNTTVKDVSVEGFGVDHAIIYPSVPVARNTGYLVGGKFFTPGDAYAVPSKPVEILAMPVGGPWLKMSEAIDYVKQVKPKVAFPIHDGIFNEPGIALSRRWPNLLLPEAGIEWVIIEDGESKEFS
jgi:L-ascorbate metabolism protein UlaG (beta-lactamase superfamily)